MVDATLAHMDNTLSTEEPACNNNKFKYKLLLPVDQDKEESLLLNALTAQTTPEFQMILCHVLLAVLDGSLKKMVHARAAQLDKLLLRMEDHAWSYVVPDKRESHQLHVLTAQPTPNFPLMDSHVNLAQSDGLLHQLDTAQDAQLVSSPKIKEPAREM